MDVVTLALAKKYTADRFRRYMGFMVEI